MSSSIYTNTYIYSTRWRDPEETERRRLHALTEGRGHRAEEDYVLRALVAGTATNDASTSVAP